MKIASLKNVKRQVTFYITWWIHAKKSFAMLNKSVVLTKDISVFHRITVSISEILGYRKGFHILYIYCFESPYFLSRLLHSVSFPVVSSEFTI